MIVVMKASATEAEIQAVVGMVEKLDYSAHIIRGVERTVVACVGEERGEQHQLGHLEAVAGVDRVMPVLRSFKLAAREVRPEGSRVNVGGVEIGGRRIVVIAGPCAVESEAQVEAAAAAVKAAGATPAARRRVQAAHLALFVPGDGRRGAGTCSRTPGGTWDCRSSPK